MNSNKIGVWMDNSHAAFIDPYSVDAVFEVLSSLNSTNQRIKGEGSNKTSFSAGQLSNNEYNMHQKQIADRKHYLRAITDRLRAYDEIFLFGPTDASRILHQQLLEDKQFQLKKLAWEKTDKMTDNQLLARVKKHFFAQPGLQ